MTAQQTAMIWGASGGIGRALVAHLAKANWVTIAIGRDETAVEESATCTIEVDDVGDETAVRRAILEASHEVAAIDLWIYTVGDIHAAPVGEMTREAWQRLLTANLTGAFVTAQQSLPLLADKAHLMFVGAIHERLRLPGLSAYAATKAGLEAFAEALRKEQRHKRVSVVRPSAVATPLWEKVPLRLPKKALSAERLAEVMLEAYHDQHTGLLDLAH